MNKKVTVKTGVTDFYVAKATYHQDTGKVEYGTPGVFGGTATVSVTVNKNSNKIYESNQMIHNSNRVSDVDIAYASRTVDLASEMEVLHGIENENGDYIVGPDDVGGHYAVGWARTESDGSYTGIWYLWAEPSKDDESDETATDTQNSAPENYGFSAAASPEMRADGKPQMKRVAKLKDATALQAFFASVLPET